MRRKIIGILIGMLVFMVLLPTPAFAGDEEHPEITDTIGDARSYLDINTAWFFEDPTTPELLYTTIHLTRPSSLPFKQHLVVSWEMNGEHYASMLAIGYSFALWYDYAAIAGRGQFGDPEPVISAIQGSFKPTQSTVTCIIPKTTIGNPEPGDVLTNTQSQCFQRFRLWGRLGFTPFVRSFLFDQVLEKWQIQDIAPDYTNTSVVYGSDYVIQY